MNLPSLEVAEPAVLLPGEGVPIGLRKDFLASTIPSSSSSSPESSLSPPPKSLKNPTTAWSFSKSALLLREELRLELGGASESDSSSRLKMCTEVISVSAKLTRRPRFFFFMRMAMVSPLSVMFGGSPGIFDAISEFELTASKAKPLLSLSLSLSIGIRGN